MSSANTLRTLHALDFGGDDAKAAVMAAAVGTDFTPLVEALYEVDKELLVKTLVHQATDGGNARRGKELADFKDMALKSVDREAWLAAQQERPQALEPCTLTEDEKAALLARVFDALKASQGELVAVGQARDALAADSAEDRALEEKMEVIFERLDNAKKLAAMLDGPDGAVYTDAFWSSLQAEENPLENKPLIDLSDVWKADDVP